MSEGLDLDAIRSNARYAGPSTVIALCGAVEARDRRINSMLEGGSDDYDTVERWVERCNHHAARADAAEALIAAALATVDDLYRTDSDEGIGNTARNILRRVLLAPDRVQETPQ